MSKIAEVRFPGGKRVDVEIGGKVVKTDQPREHGGEASAPSPLDLFFSSLAACAGFYALEFCRAREISSEGLGLQMVCDRDREKKLYTRVTLELTLPRGFPEKFRPAIVRAIDLCAVKRHIFNPPEFRILTTPAAG